ncbi:T9SS type A sorting domain-containing protein, partial [candidate division WOR-3 bacterium]|nr:T9SS type A sorting domain-containing protein [candidate division WOR-3 bacterium]
AYKVLIAAAEIGIINLARMLQDSSGGDFTCDTLSAQYRPLRNIDSLQAVGVACIITFTDYQYQNRDAFGDSLAKFVDQGGGVVVTVFADFSPWNIGGAFATRYMPIPFTSNTYTAGTLGTVHVPSHPLMAGVSTVGCGNYKTGATSIISRGGTVTRVADWTGGQVECAAMDSAGRRVVWLGFFGYGNWIGGLSGRWCRQMVNAIRWSSIMHDVGVSKLLGPRGELDSGATVAPACTVYNYGNQLEVYYKVRMRISTPTDGVVYVDSQEVFNHTPGTSLWLEYKNWTVPSRGVFHVTCSTELAGDNSPNNVKRDSVIGHVKDVCALAITAPAGSYKKDTVIRPKASWRNKGTRPATFEAWMLISDPTDARVYAQKMPVADLGVGIVVEIAAFPHCTLKTVGDWTVRCSTYHAGDMVPENDTLDRAFTVVSTGPPPPPPGVWTAKTSMPSGGKPIKDGGWLAYDEGTGLVFASRGNKTPDFFSYKPAKDSWKALDPWKTGTEGKLPGKGSAGCANGAGMVYAVKGNNKLGFWQFDAAANAWKQLKDVPLGVSNKAIKGGSGMVWARKGGEGAVYLLKGYKNEFYKYYPGADSWQTLEPAPAGGNVKWDKGSWLAYDGAHTIYAHKAKYHEFYSYNTNTDSWSPTQLPGMPIQGSGGGKKSKDGGCGTFALGSVYALKGGGTQEFWKCAFSLDGPSWTEKETLPQGALKKKVKAGAGIVAAGSTIFATKGNKSDELWAHGATLADGSEPTVAQAGVMGQPVSRGAEALRVVPNPLAAGFATLHYALPGAGPATVRVCDVTGRVVLSGKVAGQRGATTLDLRQLQPGVYLLKLTAADYAAVSKLVVER